MIRILRTECPNVLITATRNSDTYRTKAVVEALWNMQHGKCCYSEVLLPQDGHNKAVEHFHPKSVFKSKRNEWINLLLVAPQCNGVKSDQFPVMLTKNPDEVKVVYLKRAKKATPAIIDPSSPDENPEKHLSYSLNREDDDFYGQIQARNGSVRGDHTIKVTGINGPFFQRLRRNHLLRIVEQAYINLLEARDSGANAQLDQAKGRFEILMADSSDFAGLSREFAREKKLRERFGLIIPEVETDDRSA